MVKCKFFSGDAMNTSSRMMQSGEQQKIHTSKVTADLLPREFKVSERGRIEVKGKGRMTTCWVQDRAGRSPPIKNQVVQLYSCNARGKNYLVSSRSWLNTRQGWRRRLRIIQGPMMQIQKRIPIPGMMQTITKAEQEVNAL